MALSRLAAAEELFCRRAFLKLVIHCLTFKGLREALVCVEGGGWMVSFQQARCPHVKS